MQFVRAYFSCTGVHSQSTVHQIGRFYCLLPAVCSLHHRCRSLQSCRLYWRDCVDHLWHYQDHHSLKLGKAKQYASRCYVYWLCHGTQGAVKISIHSLVNSYSITTCRLLIVQRECHRVYYYREEIEVKVQVYKKVQCLTKRLSVVCLCFISNSPVSHCIPIHPTSQVQVLGAVQVPPFRQGLVQMAAVGEGGMIVHEQTKIKTAWYQTYCLFSVICICNQLTDWLITH